jgi:hypothetical protein
VSESLTQKGELKMPAIQVPSEYIDLASQWYSGQDDMLYAIASTGTIGTGTHRPWNDDENRYMTDGEWLDLLISDSSYDLGKAVSAADRMKHPDMPLLVEFSEWINGIEQTAIKS